LGEAPLGALLSNPVGSRRLDKLFACGFSTTVTKDATMDSIPFLHAGQVFTITFFDDLAFTEVRSILDHLLAEDAFNPIIQENSGLYPIVVEGHSFRVWVAEMEVIIKRD
jgi:hypothetical protein